MSGKRCHFDLETRSREVLKATGVYRYVRCPDFRILMGGWNIGAGTWTTLDHESSVATAEMLLDEGYTLVAHNAQFDRVALSAAMGLPVGTYLDPERFDDTRAHAGQRGWPQALGNLSKVLKVTEKDEAGKELIRYWSKPISNGKRKGEFRSPEDNPEKWQEFIDYLVQDVDSLVAVDEVLGGHITDLERQIYLADQRINDHGLAVDTELATHAKIAADRNAEQQKERVRELTLWDVDNPGAPQQMRTWLLKQEGIDEKSLPNMQAATVEALLEADLSHVTREVLELRQELALAAPAKYGSALTMQTGGRLRGTMQYAGAHTLRWAGRGTQPHNLPRLAFEGPAYEVVQRQFPDWTKHQIEEFQLRCALLDQDMCIADVKAGEPVSSEDLKRLVRPLFIGPLTVFDLSQIEARVIAWLSGEEWVLQAFREGRDLYVESAKRLGPGYTRSDGKIATLAFGFGGGVGSLRAFATPGSAFEEMSDDDIRTNFVLPWRKANRNIVRFWAGLQRGMGESGRIGDHIKMTHRQDPSGVATHMHLPSGRYIGYHDTRWEKYVITEKKTNKRIRKEGWRYQNAQIPFSKNARIGTYGGSLCIAGDALVLTDRGWVELCSVLLSDRVWDGVEFVAHSGLEAKGTKSTIDIEGVRMTPDHRIMQEGGWREAQQYNRSDWQDVGLPDGAPVLPLGPEDRHRVEEVFDLLDCGPRNRFTVLTDRGPLLVHNCENATQAVARDVMAEAILRLEAAGYVIVGHVHDEILIQGHHDMDVIRSIICESPTWAPDLPVDADGFHCDRYRKG